MGLIIATIIGGIIGWLAGLIMKVESQMGIIANIIVGIVGSGVGTFFSWPHRSGGLWAHCQSGRGCGAGQCC